MNLYHSSSNKSPFKEGTLVYIHEQKGKKRHLVPYIIDSIFDLYDKVSLSENKGVYALYLKNKNTGELVLEFNGQPKVFRINEVVSGKLFVFPPEGEYTLCHVCNNDFITPDNSTCFYCSKIKKEAQLIAELEAKRREEERKQEEMHRLEEERRLEEQRRIEAIKHARNKKRKFFDISCFY